VTMNSLIGIAGALLVVWICYQAVKITFREFRGDNAYRNSRSRGTEDWRRISRSMRNRDHLIFHKNGAIEVDIDKFMRHPKVQSDLRNAAKLYKAMVIKALHLGERPPHQAGDMLPMNKQRLLIEWNDEWQEQLDRLGLSYNDFFDIKEEPEPTIELTAEEIAAQYVEEKDKKEGIGESTFRKYVGSDRSLRL